MTTFAYSLMNERPGRARRAFWPWFVALFSGLLFGASAIDARLAWLAWLAPGCFLALLLAPGLAEGRAGRLGFLFAFAYHLVAASGLLGTADHMDLPPWQAKTVVFLLLLAFCAYMSVYMLAVSAIFARLALPLPLALIYWPLAWYLIEWLQGWVLGGFPAVHLGVSQAAFPWLIQSAAVWGAAGLSALIMLHNTLLAAWFVSRQKRFLGLAALLLVVNIGGGLLYMAWPSTSPAITAAVTESQVVVGERWGGESDDEIFADYRRQIEQADQVGATLILLPETAMPYELQPGSGYGASFLRLAGVGRLTIVAGGFRHVGEGAAEVEYNSLFAATPRGQLIEVYRKRALVPFGEYLPLGGLLERILPEGFLDSFPNSDLTAGGEQGAVPLPLFADEQTPVASLICYDICYAAFPRRAVQEGAELILAASNDTWYMGTTLTYQHLNHAILRAVEYGRFVLNSTNGGYSALIDEHGSITALAEGGEPAIGQLELRQGQTPFAAIGGWLIWPAAALWLLLVIFGLLGRPPAHDMDMGAEAVRLNISYTKKGKL